MIDELTAYLDGEVDRVHVRDTLADIESGVSVVHVRPERRRRPWAAPALAGAAAAFVVLIGVAATGPDAPSSGGAGLGQAPGPVVEDPASVVPPEVTSASVATTPVPTAPTLVPIPLPEGGTMQGFSPLCTTSDGIEFDCVVEGYRNAGGYGDGGLDHTGEVQVIVSSASIVSGGCRSTSSDGSTWHCAIGQRAVELDMVTAQFLGEWAPIGYAAG